MFVVSLDLCKELFSLSADIWNDAFTEYVWAKKKDDKSPTKLVPRSINYWTCWPAYDLSYLLRKLPGNSWVGYVGTGMQNERHGSMNQGYALAYIWLWDESTRDVRRNFDQRADIPEDAAARLAIELFKQGILKKELN